MAKPERDYFPIADAAQRIGCTVGDLVHWAANGKIRLGGLFYISKLDPRCHYGDASGGADRKPDEFIGFAHIYWGCFAHFEKSGLFYVTGFEMLDGSNVLLDEAELRTIDDIFMHHDDFFPLAAEFNNPEIDAPEVSGNPLTSDEREKLLKTVAEIGFKCHQVTLERDQLAQEKDALLHDIETAYALKDQQPSDCSQCKSTVERSNVSRSLAILNQAATKFWANADRDDRTTHPRKNDVVAWLIAHGFSQITAESGSTIIRPEWAPTGRIAQQ